MELNRVIIYRQSKSSSNNCSIIFVWVSFSVSFFFSSADMIWHVLINKTITENHFPAMNSPKTSSAMFCKSHRGFYGQKSVTSCFGIQHVYTQQRCERVGYHTTVWRWCLEVWIWLFASKSEGFCLIPLHCRHCLRVQSSTVTGTRCGGQPWHGDAQLSASRCVAVRSELHWHCCAGKFAQWLPALAGAVIIFLLCLSLLNVCLISPSFLPLQQVMFGTYP